MVLLILFSKSSWKYLSLWRDIMFETATAFLMRDVAKTTFWLAEIAACLSWFGILDYYNNLETSQNRVSPKTPFMIHAVLQAHIEIITLFFKMNSWPLIPSLICPGHICPWHISNVFVESVCGWWRFKQSHLAWVRLIGLWGWVRLHTCCALANQCAQVSHTHTRTHAPLSFILHNKPTYTSSSCGSHLGGHLNQYTSRVSVCDSANIYLNIV